MTMSNMPLNDSSSGQPPECEKIQGSLHPGQLQQSNTPANSQNLQHVLKAAKVPPELSTCQAMNEVQVSLEDAELWRNFKKCENEMIVTKSGRYVVFKTKFLNQLSLKSQTTYICF